MSGKKKWQGSLRRVTMAAQNALELILVGRLSEPYSAGYEVLHSDAHYSLRRYRAKEVSSGRSSGPLLLVPPLMLSAEIYDISEELSAVGFLVAEGIDVWIADFRAPEDEDGGLGRTLDDHVCAVSDAIDRIAEITRCDVHLAGYSQGGMFAYQCAAYRQGQAIASVITFGSPVDIHRSVPNFSDAFAERVTEGMRSVLGGPLSRVEGVPGTITSLAFKVMGMRKELGQLPDFLSKLHDRKALEKREAKRLFLRGDGFVAWPGPAFRTFVDEFIVANRMATGGFVICGKSLSLADIRSPILCFVGERDEMASPGAVRAIHAAAQRSEVHEVTIRAGHFGLVVGSESMRRTWPTVANWVRWQNGETGMPAILAEVSEPAEDVDHETGSAAAQDLGVDLALDVFGKFAKSAWHRASEVAENFGDSADLLRHQIPKLRRLRNIEDGTKVSFALALQTQAEQIGERTFFLWRGRAFTFEETNQRVDNIVRGLIACGVLPTQRVGVLMRGRPSYLSLMVAINRIGAVAVLLDPKFDDDVLASALESAEVAILVVDSGNAAQASRTFSGDILCLGERSGKSSSGSAGADGIVNMEDIDPTSIQLPSWYEPNPGRARDLAMIIVSPGAGAAERSQLLHISNHRWAWAAYGAAASATLTPRDTVYCCLPLHHAAGTMVSIGSALVSGARLALADSDQFSTSRVFSAERFWDDTRRYGATVVFYAGEMCRYLVDASATHNSESQHPIRLFAGSGMRPDVWERLVQRFGTMGVLEFYASTETNAVLANASGHKIGAVGRPLPGSSWLALVRYDLRERQPVRGSGGHCIPCPPNEPGLMLTKIRRSDAESLRQSRIMRSVFAPQDWWYSTGNILRKDFDGDYWFVERVADIADGGRLCLPIEDKLYRTRAVALCAAHGDEGGLVASIVVHEGHMIDARTIDNALAVLASEGGARPYRVQVVEALPMSDGFRPLKHLLRSGDFPLVVLEIYQWNEKQERYQQVLLH